MGAVGTGERAAAAEGVWRDGGIPAQGSGPATRPGHTFRKRDQPISMEFLRILVLAGRSPGKGDHSGFRLTASGPAVIIGDRPAAPAWRGGSFLWKGALAVSDRVYNFSAGPSMLPLPALERAAAEITDYRGSGQSVMEMSHRSKVFVRIFEETRDKLRRIMNIPDNYQILFLQTGATGQFSAVPLNLIGATGKADYAVTGNFSNLACKEAKKYGTIHVAASSADRGHCYIPSQSQLQLDPEASYFYYCANNTIYGTEWQYVPETGGVPLVCDMSSDILSRPVDVSKYGVIFAGAQKNMAPAGLTVVIIRDGLAGHALPFTPVIMDYQTMIDKDSMYNTPPCWCIYMLGLTLDWVEENGGIAGMEKRRIRRSGMLYDTLDASKIFHCHADRADRSGMNVTFRTGDEELDGRFVKEAAEAGFVNLKGHRVVGGMRASIYNAMPLEGVEKLCDFIRAFEKSI